MNAQSVIEVKHRHPLPVPAREETRQRIDGIMSKLVHDMRTPLTSILGFSTSLLRDDVSWTEDEKTEFLTLIVQEATHLAELLETLPHHVRYSINEFSA